MVIRAAIGGREGLCTSPASEVRLEAGGLLLRGERVPLLSGEMHFWRLDPRHWAACLRAIKAMGLSMVATYVDWRRHSLGPDENDLVGRTDPRLNLPHFLELCAEAGLWVHIRPGPWICAEEVNGGYPDWLVAQPDLQVLDASGNPVQGYMRPFQSPIPSYLHPCYLAHAQRWLADVDACIRDYCYPQGPIVMLQLDNEPSMTFHDQLLASDYNLVNVGPGGFYQRWLEGKYGSVERLNAAHGSAWPDWAAVQAPRSLSLADRRALRCYTDWAEFKEWQMAEHLATLREMHVQNGVGSILFTINYNEHPQLAVPNNWHKLEDASGLGGYDYYPSLPMGLRDVVHVAMAVNYGLAVCRVAWSPEIMCGIWKLPGTDEDCPALTAGDLEYLYFSALAFGLKGMNFYMLVNRENWAQAPLDEMGQPTATAEAVEKVVHLVDAVPNFASLRKRQPVAVMYYRPYAWEAYVAGGQAAQVAGSELASTYESFTTLYAELVRLNCDPAIWDPEVHPERLAGFRLLFVPAGACMDGPTQEMLRRYAEGGGTVVLLPGPPRLDLDLAPCALLDQGGILRTHGSWRGARLGRGTIVRPSLASTGECVGGTALRGELLQQLLAAHGLQPAVRSSNPQVLTVLQRNEVAQVLFIVNTASGAETTRLSFQGVRSGRLVAALSGCDAATVRDGQALIQLPGRTVEVCLISSQ